MIDKSNDVCRAMWAKDTATLASEIVENYNNCLSGVPSSQEHESLVPDSEAEEEMNISCSQL